MIDVGFGFLTMISWLKFDKYVWFFILMVCLVPSESLERKKIRILNLIFFVFGTEKKTFNQFQHLIQLFVAIDMGLSFFS